MPDYWHVTFLREAEQDLKQLDGSQRLLVLKAIEKVSANPLPDTQGGYGKPLGNRLTGKLAGYCKIKLRNAGLRVVYQPIQTESEMKIIVISIRDDDMVYRLAEKRTK